MMPNDWIGDLPVPDAPPTSNAADAFGQVRDTFTDCETLLNKIEGQVKGAIQACLASCGRDVSKCESCVRGAVQAQLDNAAMIGGGCQNRVNSKVMELFSRALSSAANMTGYVIPNVEQAAINNVVNAEPILPVQPPKPVDPIVYIPPNIEPPKPPSTVVILPPTYPAPPNITYPPSCPIPPSAPNIIINPPACPPANPPMQPPAPMPGPPGPIGPPGPPGPPGPIVLPPGVVIPPGFPPSWFIETIILPDNTITINIPDPPPFPPIDIDVNVVVNQPEGKPETYNIGPINQVAIPDFIGNWNVLECPIGANVPPQGEIKDYFNWYEEKTGFKTYVDSQGRRQYFGPKGFLANDENTEMTVWQYALWNIGYVVGVTLPAVATRVVPTIAGCNIGATIQTRIKLWALDMIEKYAGFDLASVKKPLEYEKNFHCPYALPGQGEIDGLYNTRRIDEETWHCWTRAIGNLDVPAKQVRHMMRPQISPSEAYRLRELWPDLYKGWFEQAVYHAGYDIDMVGTIERLQQYIPSPNDLVSFMTRDVFDETVYIPFELDAEFNDKFKGDIEKWATAQGISADKMKLFWRKHWQWPSPSQMYEMLHRWRPNAANRPMDVDPVSIDMVERVLGINDVAPIFRKRLAMLSYKVVNRLELRRQYQNDIINKDGFIDGMQDLGYSEAAAKSIAELFTRLKEQKEEKDARTLSISTIAGWYASGVVGREEAAVKLRSYKLKDFQIERILYDATLRAKAQTRRSQIANIKRRFTAGEFDSGIAIGMVVNTGIDPDQAVMIVSGWDQNVKIKGKVASAGQLCKWLAQNLITEKEFFERMVRVGWSREDAARIVGSCELDIIKKNTPKPPKPPKSAEGGSGGQGGNGGK